MKQEVWSPITGHPLYSISDYGRVKNIKTNKILKNNKTTQGYYQVSLYNSGVRKVINVHKLVALHFITNSENKPQVNHKDGNKLNNTKDNLEWCTSSENQLHAIKTGLKTYNTNRDSKNYASKLTEENVLLIFKLNTEDNIPHRDLATRFSVSKSAITNILTGKRWKKTLNTTT